MLLKSLRVDPVELATSTGWKVEPRGVCKGAHCVPLPASAADDAGLVDVRALADRLGMAIVGEANHAGSELWALGPESAVTGRALTTAEAPDLVLPTIDGEPFRLSGLLGSKVIIVSWASW